MGGLRFIYENLKINSNIGRKYLLSQEFINNELILKHELQILSDITDFFDKNTEIIKDICSLLEQINDIHGSINNLANQQVLDDIELFEIKKFSIISEKITDKLLRSHFDTIRFFDLTPIIDILDPEKTRILSFYIYSAYDKNLANLRKKQKNLEKTDADSAEKVRQDCIVIEDKIREGISEKLSQYTNELHTNLNNIAYLDVLIAKYHLAKDFNLCKPEFSKSDIEYRKLFNPQIKTILNNSSRNYQHIDIKILNSPVLITGANMSGKTVLLKTIALSQYLFQFGFYVPATSAKMMVFDKIMLSVGDNQSELNGLSSFAVEMLNINDIITEVKKGGNILVLVDELARTTNPDEGIAIVGAFIEIMAKYNTTSIITTHYSIPNVKTRRLRVNGLTNIEKTANITVDNINEFMDYSLVEINDENAPKEAIKIIEILNIDDEFLKKTRKHFE
jgi:DNA mismatch repair ATPase MutS